MPKDSIPPQDALQRPETDTEQTHQFDPAELSRMLHQVTAKQRKPCFIILGGQDIGSVIPLDTGSTVIGRATDCGIILRDCDISRHHAKVDVHADGRLSVQDLGSTNGVFVEGRRVQTGYLVEGEKLLLGRRTVMKFIRMDAVEEAYQRQLYESSTRDPLTGIYNRRYFSKKIRTDLSFARRYGLPLTLFMLDMDHFKKVNDTYGHSVGDLVLVHVGRSISNMIRENDLVARYGGEEFVVIAPGIGYEGGQRLGERIRSLIEESPDVREAATDGPLPLTVSIGGVSVSEGVSVDEKVLIAAADANLYSAKEKGRNTVVITRLP